MPLLTNPGCLLLQWIDDKPRALVTKVGAPIFFDWGYDHMAVNGGTTPRVHLYIEKPWCEVLWRFVHALAHSNHRIAVTWT